MPRNAFIDLYADATFRVESVTPQALCRAAPPPLPSLCGSGADGADGEKEEEAKSGGAGGIAGPGGGRAAAAFLSNREAVSAKTNSHEIMDELSETGWRDLCALSPGMAARAQRLARRYGYEVKPEGACKGPAL